MAISSVIISNTDSASSITTNIRIEKDRENSIIFLERFAIQTVQSLDNLNSTYFVYWWTNLLLR